ncbi:MAG: hypothetical protein K2H72_03085, partial [Muribaculaceae bacterium]|nr:hypothetical protein [Muribaculaceae bacterium]
WGAKASLDFNAPGKWKIGDASFKMYDPGFGFSLGGVYSHYFTDNFFVEPSLSIFYDTYSCDFTIMEEVGAEEVVPGIYKVGLRLPVVIGYTFDITDDFAISVFTGPELNYAFAGGYRWKDKSLKQQLDDMRLFGSDDGMQRRLSCSWKGGIGFPFSDWRVDIEAAVGLTDIIQGPASVRENRFTVSLLRYF